MTRVLFHTVQQERVMMKGSPLIGSSKTAGPKDVPPSCCGICWYDIRSEPVYLP